MFLRDALVVPQQLGQRFDVILGTRDLQFLVLLHVQGLLLLTRNCLVGLDWDAE